MSLIDDNDVAAGRKISDMEYVARQQVAMAVRSEAGRIRRGVVPGLLMVAAPALLLAGCAASPYDFPVPVMVDGAQATSMTGYMATDDEAVVRSRLSKRMGCPHGTDFVSLLTERADNRLGTRILFYRAIMRCRAAPPA